MVGDFKRGFLKRALLIYIFISFISFTSAASNLGVGFGGDQQQTCDVENTINVLTGDLQNFTNLLDTPTTYAGATDFCVRINATGLDFRACPGGGDFSFQDFQGSFDSNLSAFFFGNFSFQDFQASFDLNFSAQSSFLNSTYALIGAGGNVSWNQSFYEQLFQDDFNLNITPVLANNFNRTDFQDAFWSNLTSISGLNATQINVSILNVNNTLWVNGVNASQWLFNQSDLSFAGDNASWNQSFYEQLFQADFNANITPVLANNFNITQFQDAFWSNLTSISGLNATQINVSILNVNNTLWVNGVNASQWLFNQSDISVAGDNVSWNQSFANDLYLLVDGNGSTDNLTIWNNLTVRNEFFANHTTLVHQHTSQSDLEFNWFDDGSEIFLNSTEAEAFNIETDSSLITLQDVPSSGNNFRLFRVANKIATTETDFAITQAGPELTSYILRSFSITGNGTQIPVPFNCSTFAENIDCEADITGPDFYVLDDIETNGTLYVKEQIFINGVNVSNIAASEFSAAWATNFTNNAPVNFTSQDFQGAFDLNFSDESAFLNATYALTGVVSNKTWNVSGSNVFPESLDWDVGIGTATPSNNLEVFGNFSANNTFYVPENGRVGINEPNPDATLEIASTIGTAGVFHIDSAGNAIIQVDRGAAGNLGEVRYQTAVSTKWVTGLTDSDDAAFDGSEFFIGQAAGDDSPDLVFETSGNLGIAAVAPAYLLEVGNSATAMNVSGLLYVNNSNVGIGTSMPEGLFDIERDIDGGNVNMSLRNKAGNSNDETVSFLFGQGGVGLPAGKILSGRESVYLNPASSDSFMAFYTALDGVDTERMRILSDGNIGIGVSAPDNRLVIGNGTGNLTISPNGDFICEGTCDFLTRSNDYFVRAQAAMLAGIFFDAIAPVGIQFRDLSGDSDVFFDLTNGRVGMGDGMITPGFPLTVIGNASANVDISIWSDGNVSAAGFITRTSIFDSSKKAEDYIKNASYYLDDGEINRSKFYGYVAYPTIDYSRPVNETMTECINDVCTDYDYIAYPYNTTEEGVSLNAEVDLLRQRVFELGEENKAFVETITFLQSELCKKDGTYGFC